MVSRLEVAALDWLRRLGQETGAFSVDEAALQSSGQGAGVWRPEVEAMLSLNNGRRLHMKMEVRARLNPAEAIGVLKHMSATKEGAVSILCSPAISQRVAELCRE